MWSDWIRSLRDKELLYKKGLLLVDQLEAAAQGAFQAAWEKVIQVRTILLWIFVVAVGSTLAACAFWLLFRLIGVEAAGYYQVLIIPVGLTWAAFLVCTAVLLGTFEGVIKQFPRLEKPLADVKQGILKWLRLPAWVGLVALFLAVLLGRFPELCKPESFLSLLSIIAAFGLASFLGLCSVNVTWFKRFVQIQLLIALVLLLLAPQFPNVTAWLERKVSLISTNWGLKANPKRVAIDPDSPPEFFVAGKPRFWFSLRSENEYVLWDAKGFDPDTGTELQPVTDAETRAKILASISEKNRVIRERKAAEQAENAPKQEALRKEEQLRAERLKQSLAVEQANRNAIDQAKGETLKFITITKQRSDPIILNTKNGLDLRYQVSAVKSQTSYFIHYNGGKGKPGGWDLFIPTREDREKLKWKKGPQEFGLNSISFSLPQDAPMDEAELRVTITPDP